MRARFAAINWYDEAVVALFAIGDGAIVWLAIAAFIRSHNPDRIVVAPLAIGVGALLANIVPRASLWFGLHWGVSYGLTGFGFLLTIAIWTKSAVFSRVPWFDMSWFGHLIEGIAFKGDGVGEVVWLSVIGAGFVWRRGAGWPGQGVDVANEQLRQGGVAAVAALGLNAALHGGVGNGAASLAAIVFFAASLTAISLARSAAILGGVDVGRTTSPSIIAGPAAIVVGVGLIAGALISRDLLNTLIWLLGYPVGAIFVARYLLIAIAFVALVILWPVFWLLQRWTPHAPAKITIPAPAVQPRDANKVVQNPTVGQLPDVVRYGLAALVFVIVCLIVVRIATKRRQAQLISGDETRERLADDEGGSLLGDLWAKFRGRKAGPDPLAGLRDKPEWAHTVAIREAFGQFLEWTRERGLARKSSSTATEHGVAFEATLAAPSPDAETLLAGYQRIRYRNTPASANEAETTVEAWRRLQRDHRESE